MIPNLIRLLLICILSIAIILDKDVNLNAAFSYQFRRKGILFIPTNLIKENDVIQFGNDSKTLYTIT